MSIILIISTIILIVGIILFFSDIEIGSSLIIFSILFGFIGGGFLIPVDNEKVLIKDYSIIQTQYRVIINAPNHYMILKDIKYKNLKKENINLFLIKPINSYNMNIFENKLEIEYKSKH